MAVRTRRALRQVAAGGLAVCLLNVLAPPAHAFPAPRAEQWWFTAWEIREKVWPITQGAGATVAIIDEGVDTTIPDLAHVESYMLDINYETERIRGPRRSKSGHGTGMAALIGSTGRTTGMRGIAPKAKLFAIEPNHAGWDIAIRYAVDRGAKVINISVVGSAASCPVNEQSAVDYALQKDAVIISVAGNQGQGDFETLNPANCEGVIAVGGLESNKQIYTGSTPGDNVTLAGPATHIAMLGIGGRYQTGVRGTSAAAALTSGAAALIRSRYPDMSAEEVAGRLIGTARDVGPKGWDKHTGFGAVIPYDALTKRNVQVPRNPVTDRYEYVAKKEKSVSAETSSSSPHPAAPGSVKTESTSSFSPPLPVWASLAVIPFLVGGIALLRRRARGRE